jgi:hypothetical protein
LNILEILKKNKLNSFYLKWGLHDEVIVVISVAVEAGLPTSDRGLSPMNLQHAHMDNRANSLQTTQRSFYGQSIL